MKIIKDHVPIRPDRRPGRKMNPTSITIHGTGNEKSRAKGERAWLENPENKREASWNYCVDDTDIIEAIPPNEVSLHSGTSQGNNTSISIEICESGNRELTLQRTQELVRYLMDKHNIRVIKRHYDWSKKNCPRILNTDGKWSLWLKFLGEIFNPPKTNPKEKEVDWMSQPIKFPVREMDNALLRVLQRFEKKEPALGREWRTKFINGQLTGADAVGLIFIAIDRGYITGKGE